MTRDQKASILADVIRLAREGNTQAAIARAIGTNPSRVYKICKKYGIRTKHMLRREKKLTSPVQCLLPL